MRQLPRFARKLALVHEVRLLVEGRVQGVGFRASTHTKALALQLTGYVRNLPNGTVEIVAQGPRESLRSLESWAQRGPSYARVDAVAVEVRQPTELFATFEIR